MYDELMARIDGAPDLQDRLDILRQDRSEEFLRIGINDTNSLMDFPAVSTQSSDLAENCLHGAYETARTALLAQLGIAALRGRIAVVAMGKLGAGELNYNFGFDHIFYMSPRKKKETERS